MAEKKIGKSSGKTPKISEERKRQYHRANDNGVRVIKKKQR